MTEEPLVTTRNLIDADIGPLRRFAGILDSMPTEEDTTFKRADGSSRIITLVNFKDIEVVEAIEPYAWPTYTYRVGQSNRKKSRWGIFGDSFNNVVDSALTEAQKDKNSPEYIPPKERTDIKDCIGKRFGLVMADGEGGRPDPPMLFDGRASEDKPTPTWMVYMVEGFAIAGGEGKSALEVAMGLLDGKTLADFNKAALDNQTIRNDVDLLQSIALPPTASNSFTTAMLAASAFTKDEQEVFHRVQ